MKHKLFGLFCLLLIPINIGSCNKSPERMTDYYHDHYTHWAYDKDANEIEKKEHTCDENHVCTVCGFTDPIFEVNEDGVLVSLTKHGMSLSNLVIPNDVVYINDNAFYNSKAKSVYVPSNVVGMSKNAYNFVSSLDHSFDKGVEFIEKEDGYYQSGIFEDSSACLIGNKTYESLDDALDAVTYNNTKIYLLKSEQIITKSHDIALETRITRFPLHLLDGATISGNLNVTVSGVLEFGSNISYTGNVNLKIRKVNEYYSSGAVAFQGLESAPKGVTVRYVGDFITTNDKIVRGACQTRNKLLIFPVDYYAYGVLEFNKEFNMVTGLSDFGASCSNLTITAPIEGVNAEIQYQGLTQEYRKYLKIFKEIINVTVFVVDGVFQNLTIENGITRVKGGAFKSFVGTNFTEGVTKLCYLLFSHIKSVTFGRDCQYVESQAFGWNKKMTSINGGEDLLELHRDAFTNCSTLKSVNISNATKINFIDHSFPGCGMLCRFVLPYSNGWKFNDNSYMYEDLTPENVAKFALSNNYVFRRYGIYDQNMYGVYNSNSIDEFGMPNKVKAYPTLDNAIAYANNNDYIRLLNPNADLSGCTFYVNKNIHIDGTKTVNYPVDLRCTFKVLSGASVDFTNRIKFSGSIIYA